MFASSIDARRSLRRQVFYCCTHERRLLPLDLSGAAGKRKKYPILFHRRCSVRSGFSSLSALQARMLTRNSRLVGDAKYGFARFALD